MMSARIRTAIAACLIASSLACGVTLFPEPIRSAATPGPGDPTPAGQRTLTEAATEPQTQASPAESATPVTTAAPRRPHQVAFIKETHPNEPYGDVVLMDTDTGELTTLVSGFDVYQIAWSADGESLKLAANRRSFVFTHLLNVSSGEVTPLTDNERPRDIGAFVDITQDGTKQVFASYRQGEITVVTSADGSSQVVGQGYSPQWSPDGKRIVFAGGPGSSADDLELYTMASDGTDIQKLVAQPGQDDAPTWSPDGKTIAFINVVKDAAGNIDAGTYLVNPDGSDLRRLRGDSSFNTQKFLPDGKALYQYSQGKTCLTPLDGADPDCLFALDSALSPDLSGALLTLVAISPKDPQKHVPQLCMVDIQAAKFGAPRCLFISDVPVFNVFWRPGK